MRFFVLFYFYSIVLFAQQSQWQPITISDGLSQGMVYDILQDHEGYMWMATKAGLNRYDGYNFKLFTTHTTPSYAITSNQTTALFKDSKQRLWIGTETGELNLFDSRTQRFYHCLLANKSNKSQTAGQHVYCIAEDSEGDLWVGTLTGSIFKIVIPDKLKKGNFPDKEDFTFQIEAIPIKTPFSTTSRINFIKRLKNKQLIVGTQAGLGRIDYVTNQYIPIAIEYGLTNRFMSMYEETDGSMILTQPNQVLKVKNNKTELLYSIHPEAPAKSQIRVDERGNVLILENKRLFKTHYTQLNADILNTSPIHQSENLVLFNALKSDNQGHCWISTGGYGLLKEIPGHRKFNHYFKGTSIWALFQDSYNRLIINHFKAFFISTPTIAAPPSLQRIFTDAHAVVEDGKQGFWQLRNDSINYSKMTLTHLNKNFEPLNHYELQNKGVGENLGRMYKDKKGHLLIVGIGSSLIQFDILHKKFSYFSYEKIIPSNVKVYSGYPDSQGNVWLSTQNGLLKAIPLPKGGYQFNIYQHNPHKLSTIAENQISMVLDDPLKPDSYLWIATHGGGLDRLNKRDDSFVHFTIQNGLPSDYVVGILADNTANLWLSTYYGIAQFNTKTFTSTNYTAKDGLQSDEFSVGACFKSKTGELMFGGVNGLSVFQPADFNKKKSNILLKINQLKINNQEISPLDETGILEQNSELTKEFDLSHNQNQVTFGFSLIDFENAQKNRFRYQLVGIDKDWIEAGTTRSVNFSQLPTGTYIFKLIGSADGSDWSKPFEVKFTIHPPFYRTWWAYFIYLSIATYLIYRWNQSQLNRVRLQEQLLYKDKEAERLAELDSIKTSFFANISHEFRTPLTLILGPMEQIVQEYATDIRFPMIQRNAQRLLMLINQLLDISKLEAGEMKPEITRTELVRYFRTLASSFTSLAESREIQFNISQNQSDITGFIDEDKVEKIITNLLSNAFKFTNQHGKVKVNINYLANQKNVEIVISDTGIGIEKVKLDKIFNRFYQIEAGQKRGYEGTGIGLALVKELVEVLKGSIQVESTENVGTTFIVKLPIDGQTWKEHRIETPRGAFPSENGNVIYPKDTHVADKPLPIPAVAEEGSLMLIIDDNPDIRAYVRSIFERDYQVLEAIDGQEGLERTLQYSPDIVICDLMMPRMDGFEFCKHLKSDERISHIPVVMLTAKATLEDRIEGFELGADDYLTKPFNKAEIQSRVRNLLKKQEKLRHYFSTKTLEMKPSELKVSAVDATFLKKIRAVLEEHLSNNQFGVVEFAAAMNMSKSQLNRKLNALCNSSSNELIRDFRLQRAAELLTKKVGTVSEIAYQVGYEHLSYFSKSFQEKFGKLPSEY